MKSYDIITRCIFRMFGNWGSEGKSVERRRKTLGFLTWFLCIRKLQFWPGTTFQEKWGPLGESQMFSCDMSGFQMLFSTIAWMNICGVLVLFKLSELIALPPRKVGKLMEPMIVQLVFAVRISFGDKRFPWPPPRRRHGHWDAMEQ